MPPTTDDPAAGEGGAFRWLAAALSRRELTARRAAVAISVVTLLVTVLGGLAMWLFVRSDFPTLGSGLWWSVQTVTTVGYGDLVPADAPGRIIASVVMLSGIAFITVITAAVTAMLVQQLRQRRHGHDPEAAMLSRLEEIASRLEAIEARFPPAASDDQGTAASEKS